MRVNCTKGKDEIKFRLKNSEDSVIFFSVCDKCKNVGHATDDCPIRKCFKCKGFGHSHFDCPNRRFKIKRGRRADDEREKFKNFRKAFAWYPRRKRSVERRWRRHVSVPAPRVRDGGDEGARVGSKRGDHSSSKAAQQKARKDGAQKEDDDVRVSKLQK